MDRKSNMQEIENVGRYAKLQTSPLVGARFPIEQAKEAYEAIKGAEKPLVALLTYPNAEKTSILDNQRLNLKSVSSMLRAKFV